MRLEPSTSRCPRAVLRDGAGGGWLVFERAEEAFVACRVRDVAGCLVAAGEAVERKGLWAVGYVAYEAAPAFDTAFAAHPPGREPLLWLGLFAPPERRRELPESEGEHQVGRWTPSLSREEFGRAFVEIRGHLERGDSYQVNLTARLRATFGGDPWSLFADLAAAQDAGYAAYLDLGETAIASASPELFFEQEGDRVVSRPMKGTAPRGRTLEEDEVNARALRASAKERAENVMVVDMIRNDLGRVARPGSVRVEELFAVERYPTVLQMTSAVSAATNAAPADVLAALFPCASITGAPKVRTTEIIAALEPSPRGVYTGAVGYLAPGRRARFNVAIRTAVVDRRRGEVEYGVGGGIVADSDPAAEWEEIRLKARVLGGPPPRFELLESLRWEPVPGEPRGRFFFLDEHRERLRRSARYFGFHLDEAELGRRLAAVDRELAGAAPVAAHKVRLLLNRGGSFRLEVEPLPETSGGRFLEIEAAGEVPPQHLALATAPVDSSDRFLFHKTTHRQVYTAALAAHGQADDVVLWNERGELTETTRANLVLEIGGDLLTPPVSCGLLAGTYRRRLLAEGRVREALLRAEDLRRAARVLLVNSVRGARRGAVEGGVGETAVSAAGEAGPPGPASATAEG